MGAEVPTAADPFVRPYRPGFADWLLARSRIGSRRGWLAYVMVAAILTFAYWAVATWEGTLPANAGLMHVLFPLFSFAGLPALRWFNRLALRALASARPLLEVDPAGYELLTYRLTTMPAWLAVVAAGIGLLSLAALTIFRPPNTFEILHIMVTPAATAFEWAFQFLTWTGVGVVGIEIGRKLWVIDDIYRNHMQINVLRSGALSAFSHLAAAMVIFTLSAVVLATIALAELGTSLSWAVGAAVPTVLAAVAFIAPLWGGHRSMAREKTRNLDALSERIETTITSLRALVDSGQLEEVGPLKVALEGLIAARNEYQAVSTWPWQRSTIGGVVTALVAPLGVWVATRVLEAALRP